MNKHRCYYCDKLGDLRPYGPRGSMVCFPCAMETPERVKETERNMDEQMDACGNVIVIDGSNTGPYPLDTSKGH